MTPETLYLQWPDLGQLRESESNNREKTKTAHDIRHRATTLPTIKPGDRVWVRDAATPAVVQSEHGTPHSFIVGTDKGGT